METPQPLAFKLWVGVEGFGCNRVQGPSLCVRLHVLEATLLRALVFPALIMNDTLSFE